MCITFTYEYVVCKQNVSLHQMDTEIAKVQFKWNDCFQGACRRVVVFHIGKSVRSVKMVKLLHSFQNIIVSLGNKSIYVLYFQTYTSIIRKKISFNLKSYIYIFFTLKNILLVLKLKSQYTGVQSANTSYIVTIVKVHRLCHKSWAL